MTQPNSDFHTRAIHAGESPDASAMPIFQSATVAGSYTRDGHNPTIEALEEKVCHLEGARVTLATASGMSAISQTLMALMQTGDRVVTHQTMYSGVQKLLKQWLPRYGFDVCQVDMRDPSQVKEALRTPTRVVYFEPIANPLVEVLDAPALIEMAHQAGAVVMTDNTFLTPYLFRPLDCGADIVVHSAMPPADQGPERKCLGADGSPCVVIQYVTHLAGICPSYGVYRLR